MSGDGCEKPRWRDSGSLGKEGGTGRKDGGVRGGRTGLIALGVDLKVRVDRGVD